MLTFPHTGMRAMNDDIFSLIVNYITQLGLNINKLNY